MVNIRGIERPCKKMGNSLDEQKRWLFIRFLIVIILSCALSLLVLFLGGRDFDIIDFLEVTFFPFGFVLLLALNVTYQKHKSNLENRVSNEVKKEV